MSSKLVKKLLHQTSAPLRRAEDATDDRGLKRKSRSAPSTTAAKTKDELVQDHIQSMLRMDALIDSQSSKTAKRSFTRQSHELKRRHKERQSAKKTSTGNTRGSSSVFSQQKYSRTYNKTRDKKEKEEEYFNDIARALKRAKKSSKR
mmetsp:Transcript_17529/g.40048  ORF Transcript_17529/g.40048 Transcript_17529/m.40048 type:complete len:147 (-) Transcript_17529:99-539(-)